MQKSKEREYPIPFHNDVFFKYMLIGEDAGSKLLRSRIIEEIYGLKVQRTQVLNPELQPIYLGTDQIYGGNQGTIYYDEGGLIGQLGVFLFEDTGALERNGEGLFVGAQGTAAQDAEVLNGYLERSNTDIVKQMTEMITYQRALQSAAQVSKMYDQLMTKATTEIGRM